MAGHIALDANRLLTSSGNSSRDGDNMDSSSSAAPVEHAISIDIAERKGVSCSEQLARYTNLSTLETLTSVQIEVGIPAECRICQEEDELQNLEAPCSCCGSAKHAHRDCIQRWCDQKGDTICEICRQEYKHGYLSTPRPADLEGSGMVATTDENLSGRPSIWDIVMLMFMCFFTLVIMPMFVVQLGEFLSSSRTFLQFCLGLAGFMAICCALARAMNILQSIGEGPGEGTPHEQ